MSSRLVSQPNRLSTRTKVAGTGIAAVAILLIVLAAAGVFSGGSNNNLGTVSAGSSPSTSTGTSASPAVQQYPFGKPSSKADYGVPPPPEEPSLVPTIATRTTTRLYGANVFQEAVSITQHIWPSALPLNAPNERQAPLDRPRALTLLTADDPLTAITATPLIHFPNDAPVLYVTKNGIPQVTLNEIKRLGVTGIARYNNVDAFLVGAAANSGVKKQLSSIGMKYVSVTASSAPALANTVDKLYGSIQNPDTGVPGMGGGATMGDGSSNVVIGSTSAYNYVLPATHWVAHMASGLLWVNPNSVPSATITALKRRHGQGNIYLFGGTQQISQNVAGQLAQYGRVVRVDNNDAVAFNSNPTDTASDTAIGFSKMWDPMGMFGWKITGAGHGFTLVNQNDWAGAVASSPLSHLGFHAPLLMTSDANTLPPELDAYYKSVAPTFTETPADGPYNMTYVIGNWKQVTWSEQVHIDGDSEMANRRLWSSATGSGYNSSEPTP
jgi:hypothetical protein